MGEGFDKVFVFTCIGVIIIILIVFSGLRSDYGKHVSELNSQNLKVESGAFVSGGPIPSKYTCEGKNINPELTVVLASPEVKYLALIVDDPDAGNNPWVHWLKWNIPVKLSRVFIKEGEEPEGISGQGSGGSLSYEGPCPPSGTHRYFFRFYGLDDKLRLGEGATRKELEKAIEKHILETGEIVGLYKKNDSR